MKIGFISLGCSKNLVDSEKIMGMLKEGGHTFVNHAKDAECIIVNTCGFIQSAKEEAINTILEMADYKKSAKCKYLIVMGCLVQRYKKELIKAIPEVDLFVGVDEYENIWNLIENLIEEKKEYISELNVFPVPDGDTGTNMTLTITSAAREVANMIKERF